MLKRNHLFLYGIIAVCCTIEAILSAGQLGIIGASRLRQLAYDYGAFWPGLLDNWRANYAAQPYLMFVTYGFLHGGSAHLVVNMITLWSLGRAVIERVGQIGFALLYVGASLGGGAGFALLAPGLRPMVGASGALFGLVGGVLAWAYVDRYTYREGLWPIVRVIVLLAALNVVLWWAMKGQLAWEAHLGGFLVGWVMALLIDPRPLADG